MSRDDNDQFSSFGGQPRFPLNNATDHYVQQLTSALFRSMRIDDPGYAIRQDPLAWKKIQRDAKFKKAIKMRRDFVAGNSFSIKAATDLDIDKAAASIVEQAFKKIPNFVMARFNLTSAIFRGTAYAFMTGSRREWSPVLGNVRDGTLTRTTPDDWWMLDKLQDIDRLRFRRRREGIGEEARFFWQLWSLSRNAWEEIEHPEWIASLTYENSEDSLDYGEGLLNAIYFYWYAKMIALEEGLGGLERWARGFIIGKVKGAKDAEKARPNTAVVQEWLNFIHKSRSKHAMVIDSEDEFTISETSGTGHKIVEFFLNYCDNAIIGLCLGSVLPTGDGGDKGSLARAETEKETTEDYLHMDRELISETMTEGPLKLFWNLNRSQFQALGLGDAQMPSYVSTNEIKPNPEKAATVITAALGAGIPLRKDEVYESLGFSMPGEDDDVIEGRAEADPLTGLFSDIAIGRAAKKRKKYGEHGKKPD